MQVSTFVCGSVAAVALAVMASASAAEYPIGKQHIENGMEVGAVYSAAHHHGTGRHDAQGLRFRRAPRSRHPRREEQPERLRGRRLDTEPASDVRADQGRHDAKHQGRHDGHGRKRRPALRRQRKAFWPGQIPPETFNIAPPMQTSRMAFGRHVDKKRAWVRGSSPTRSNTISRSPASARRAGTEHLSIRVRCPA